MKSGFEKENNDMFNIIRDMEPDDVSKINPYKGFDPRRPNGSSMDRQEKLIPTYDGLDAPPVESKPPVQKPTPAPATAPTPAPKPAGKKIVSIPKK